MNAVKPVAAHGRLAEQVPAFAAIGLLGFVVDAVRRDYYQLPREDALILWHRQLAGPGSLW